MKSPSRPLELPPVPGESFADPTFTAGDAGDHDLLLFDRTDFTGVHADGSSFLECYLRDARIDRAHLEGTRWGQAAWERVVGTDVDLSGASLIDTVLEGCRLAAVSAYDSHWRDVTVRGGKVDFLNLRGARLRDVRFVDCIITELDLADARLERVSFAGCTLVEPQFSSGTYVAVDLSEAELRSPRGLASLRGVLLGRAQVIDLADHLAAELGILVRD